MISGDYILRVEFLDGRGIIDRFEARDFGVPTEDELVECLDYLWNEGNFSCDCNLSRFLHNAGWDDEEWDRCGETLRLRSLTLVCPDGRERSVPVG